MIFSALSSVLDRLLLSCLSCAPVFVVGYCLCRFMSLHPAAKTWIMRICFLKLAVSFACGWQFFAASQVSFSAKTMEGGTSSILLALAFSTWFYGCAVKFGAWVRDWRAAVTLHNVGRPGSPGLCGQVESLAGKLGLARTIRVSVCDTSSCAAVLNPLRPEIVLPCDGRPSQFELAHELAHIKHGDLLWWPAQQAVAIFFWFVPGMGSVLNEVALAQEEWADLSARTATETGWSDASAVILSRLGTSGRTPGLTLSGAGKTMKRRLTALRKEHWPSRVSLAALVIVVMMASFGATASSPDRSLRRSASPVRMLSIEGERTPGIRTKTGFLDL